MNCWCCCYSSVFRVKPVNAFNLMVFALVIVCPKRDAVLMFGFKFFAKCRVFCSFSFAAWNLIAATAIFTFQRSRSFKSKRINDYLALIFFCILVGLFFVVCWLGIFWFCL